MPILESTVAPGLLRWTLSNPPRRNALDLEMLEWIPRRCAELAGEVVLLTGEGERVFCAGFDLTALPRLAAERPGVPPDQPLLAASAAISAADATFIAVLQGAVIGAGVELACACDLLIARPGVTFHVPASKLGVVYHAAGIVRFHAVFGPALCRRLLLAGETIDAALAERAGALAALVDAADLQAAGEALGQRLLGGAPGSLRAHRDLLRELDRGGLSPDRLRAHSAARDAAYAATDLGAALQRALGRGT